MTCWAGCRYVSFMIHFIATALLSLCLLSACNNERAQRLSKRGFYEADNDAAAYALTEVESKLLKTTTLSEEDLFSVAEFKSTITIEDINEGKVTLSIIGKNVSDSTFSTSVSSAAGLTPSSKINEPVSFEVPITNKNGALASVRVTVLFGNTGDPEQANFLTIDAKAIPVVESDADDNVEPAPPETFTSFYSNEGDEVSVYEFKELKEDVSPTFFLHQRNLEKTENILKISTRLTLRTAAAPSSEAN